MCSVWCLVGPTRQWLFASSNGVTGCSEVEVAERSAEGGDAGDTGSELEMAGASPSTDGSGAFAIAVDPQRREHALRHVIRFEDL